MATPAVVVEVAVALLNEAADRERDQERGRADRR
jgi:hypothetical protein